MTKTKFEQVIENGVPSEDRNLVSGHAQLLLNTQGGIPSAAAQLAVVEYNRLGRDAFSAMSHNLNVSAMRSCASSGCSACRRSAENLTAR